MTLAPRNPQIPGSTKPRLCRQPSFKGKGKCNRPGNNLFEGKIELFGKEVPVKVAMCNEHFAAITPDVDHFSIAKEKDSGEGSD